MRDDGSIDLSILPGAEKGYMLTGLGIPARGKIADLRKSLQEAEERVRHFEQKYGMGLDDFEQRYLPEHDGLQEHEDYTDWYYAQQVLKATGEAMEAYQQFVQEQIR